MKTFGEKRHTDKDKVPDCALTDTLLLNMENEDSSDESGEMICSELDVPIITSEALEPVVTLYLSAITDDQWVLLAAGKVTSSTFSRLYKMCSEILKIISSQVLEVVEPQVEDWMFIHATQDDHNMKNRNFYSVTEDDIKASLGNSFDRCFGEVTGIPQERSNESIALLELFAAEVKKRVNQSLTGVTSSAGQSASCPQTVQSNDSETSEYYDCDYDATEMVHQVATILNCLLQNDTESPIYRDTVSSMDFSSEQGIIDVEQFCYEELCTEDTTMCHAPPDVKSFAKATEKKNLGDMILEEFSSSSPESTGSIQLASMASSDTASEEGDTSPSKEQRLKMSGKKRSFGHKVRTFFNRKTSKVIPACDLNTSVSHSCAEDATITRPVPNMQRSDSEEAVINSSSELLNNSPPKNRSFRHKWRTFFSSKTSKVTPGSDLNTSENQGSRCRVSRNTSCPDEEFCSEDSVTPTCENGLTESSKQSAIMRILSSTGKILMKPFTCCRSRGMR